MTHLPFDPDMPHRMHLLFCRLTESHLVWSADRLFPWEKWCLRFTEADLRLLISYLKDQKRLGRPARSLTFRSLISGPESIAWAEEDLAQARAMARAPRPHPARAVLAATHRPDPTPQPAARSAGDVIRGQAELKRLLDLRDSL